MVGYILKAPFPYFGGKSRVADIVWTRFGDPPNYIEPFYGTGAVTLARPGWDIKAGVWKDGKTRIETVSDADGFLVNFWRAVQAEPEKVAYYADYPVSEIDLHARHDWLMGKRESLTEVLVADPEFYDERIAGWWVWGMCCWIGSGWCSEASLRKTKNKEGENVIIKTTRQIPQIGGSGRGVNNIGARETYRKLPYLKSAGQGVSAETYRSLVHLGSSGQGVTSPTHRKIPHLGTGGRGLVTKTHRKIPFLAGGNRGFLTTDKTNEGDGSEFYSFGMPLVPLFTQLSHRLRETRISYGDWSRITGKSVTYNIGLTGVFLDPPYSLGERAGQLYAAESIVDEDSMEAIYELGDTEERESILEELDSIVKEEVEQAKHVSEQAREWAIANGDNPLLRIALCGYLGEHEMPADWEVYRWKAQGGYGTQGKGRGRDNSERETIWFSPHCINPEEKPKTLSMFDGWEL